MNTEMNGRRILQSLIIAAATVAFGLVFTDLAYMREEQMHRITHFTLLYPQSVELYVASFIVFFLWFYYILYLLNAPISHNYTEKYEECLNQDEKGDNCLAGTGGKN